MNKKEKRYTLDELVPMIKEHYRVSVAKITLNRWATRGTCKNTVFLESEYYHRRRWVSWEAVERFFKAQSEYRDAQRAAPKQTTNSARVAELLK